MEIAEAAVNWLNTPVRKWLQAAAIVLLVLVAYWPSINGQFLWDDNYWICMNPVIEQGQAPWGYWWTDKTLDYLPVTSTFFYIQSQLFGLPRAAARGPQAPSSSKTVVRAQDGDPGR